MTNSKQLHTLGVTQLSSNKTAVPDKVLGLWEGSSQSELAWHYNPLSHKVEVMPVGEKHPLAGSEDTEGMLDRCRLELDCRD